MTTKNYRYYERGSRMIHIKYISGDFSTVLNRRMIINLVGLWS